MGTIQQEELGKTKEKKARQKKQAVSKHREQEGGKVKRARKPRPGPKKEGKGVSGGKRERGEKTTRERAGRAGNGRGKLAATERGQKNKEEERRGKKREPIDYRSNGSPKMTVPRKKKRSTWVGGRKSKQKPNCKLTIRRRPQ